MRFDNARNAEIENRPSSTPGDFGLCKIKDLLGEEYGRVEFMAQQNFLLVVVHVKPSYTLKGCCRRRRR